MGTGFPQADFRNTPHTAVVPFYLYAAVSLLAGSVLLFLSASLFTGHYFNPGSLAITHIMALGWGTMIILGASHQLVPVLTEKSLYSLRLAHLTFWLAACGIPLLVYGFYKMDMGWPAKWGGRLLLLAILVYVINLFRSLQHGKKMNVHAVYILTAALWLFITAFLGLTLVYNFTIPFLPQDILAYLPLHAHAGIIGWFLLLIIGVGSRLIPMFLISKYQQPRLLYVIYFLINGGLLFYQLSFLWLPAAPLLIPACLIGTGLFLFVFYCIQVFRQRIRKQVDEPMKISLLSVSMIVLPLLTVLVLSGRLLSGEHQLKTVQLYGFVIFFGWITALILGMTFKTLPFIIWNKVYHEKAGVEKTPNPNDLYNKKLFAVMALIYLAGFVLFSAGILLGMISLLQTGAVLLTGMAFLYCLNVYRVWKHKPV
ncbi:MAG: cytochrome C oxidase subunit I [Chitinophagales bacterium]|nr:cytochrome C oxidase subunit I [Chitinophagales bacterium]